MEDIKALVLKQCYSSGNVRQRNFAYKNAWYGIITAALVLPK